MELSTKLLNVHISLRACLLQVIEPLLRSMKLSKRVVEHLCQVEIQIVESLAWASDSPLWEEVRTNEGCLPPCKQVRSTTSIHGTSSSVPHWRLVTACIYTQHFLYKYTNDVIFVFCPGDDVITAWRAKYSIRYNQLHYCCSITCMLHFLPRVSSLFSSGS